MEQILKRHVKFKRIDNKQQSSEKSVAVGQANDVFDAFLFRCRFSCCVIPSLPLPLRGYYTGAFTHWFFIPQTLWIPRCSRKPQPEGRATQVSCTRAQKEKDFSVNRGQLVTNARGLKCCAVQNLDDVCRVARASLCPPKRARRTTWPRRRTWWGNESDVRESSVGSSRCTKLRMRRGSYGG